MGIEESGDGDGLVQVNVLDTVQQFNAFVHRFLEGLAPGNQSLTTSTLVDDSGRDGFSQVARTFRLAA